MREPGQGGASLLPPGSILQRWCRLPGLALAAPRAVMLQYAHPAFAAASQHYSGASKDPGARFDRAVRTLRAIVYEPAPVAERQARRVDRLHGVLSGTLPDGTAWSARDPAASAWVLITLVDAVIFGAELTLGRRDEAQVARALAEARSLGALFHVRPKDVPQDRAALAERVERAVTSELAIGEEARAMWAFLGKRSADRRRDRIAGAITTAFAAATLPRDLRPALGATMSIHRERALLAAGAAVARAVSARTVLTGALDGR